MTGKFGRRESVAAWVGGPLAKREEVKVEFNERTLNVDGWFSLHMIDHMCFPPEVFPRGAGAGSGWGCRECGSVWISEGTQIIGDYPEPGSKHEQAVGPLRWLYVKGVKSDEQIQLEQDLYDWRSTVFYNARLLRRLIELNGGAWEDV